MPLLWIIVLLLIILVFPLTLILTHSYEVTEWIRRARRWLRDDIRHRVSDEQWEKIDLPHDWSIHDLPDQAEGRVKTKGGVQWIDNGANKYYVSLIW